MNSDNRPAAEDAAGPGDGHGHGHPGRGGHSHLPGADADRGYLLIALVLLAAFMLAEVVVAVLAVINDSCFTDGCAPRLLDELQGCIAGHFDVEHSTFQFEAATHASHEPGTH